MIRTKRKGCSLKMKVMSNIKSGIPSHTIKNNVLLFLMLISLFVNITPSVAATQTSAQKLNELGLISNISSVELNTTLNRIVGLTMILKSLGYKDSDANKTLNSLAFKDLTGAYKWGAGWANIGVERSISMGTSSTTFSPGQLLSKKEFLSYQLRILGYGVTESWDNCAKLSLEAGLITSERVITSPEKFTKADAANIMYAALNAKMKKQPEITLIEYLVDEGVVDRDKAMKQKLISINKPQIDSIRAVSNTRIELNLKNQVYTTDIKHFSLKSPYGSVDILSATLSADGKVIYLTTETQSAYITHTITVDEKTSTYTSINADGFHPFLSSIEVISNTSIRVIFNEKVDVSALNVANYTINGIYVTKAVYEIDSDDEIIEDHIILTTTKQAASTSYVLKVSNIKDLAGNTMGTNNYQLGFLGKATDGMKPKLYSAFPIGMYKLQVNFSEDVDEATAEDLVNYEIEGFTIINAERQSQQGIVYLTMLEPMNGSFYTIKVKNIRDLEGNELDPLYTSVNFYAINYDTTKPKIISAISTSNTTVRVTFSEPISVETGVIELAYNLGTELGYPLKVTKELSVFSAVWILTTKPQENIVYTLDVTGVQDLAGNILDEEYDTATFTGIE